MKPKKTKDIQKALLSKGFEIDPKKNHHNYYCLVVDGKKRMVQTYFSHSGNECDAYILGKMKLQLRFETSEQFDKYIECTFSKEEYINMLYKNNQIS